MSNRARYQSVFIKGMVEVDAYHASDEESATTRLVVATKDYFKGGFVVQRHNVIALNEAAYAVKDLKKGDGVRIIGKLLWLESEYAAQDTEEDRSVEIIALIADKVVGSSIDDSYQQVVVSGELTGDISYTANMEGAGTKSLISTVDRLLGEDVEQSHSVLALDQLAVTLKNFAAGDTVLVAAKVLWLDCADYAGDKIRDNRSAELMIESIVLETNRVPAKIKGEQVNKNILGLNKRLQNSELAEIAAYTQSILNQLNLTK